MSRRTPQSVRLRRSRLTDFLNRAPGAFTAKEISFFLRESFTTVTNDIFLLKVAHLTKRNMNHRLIKGQ